MHYYKTLIFFSLLIFTLCLAEKNIIAQQVSRDWYGEMEEKRAESIRSLWQSERQPIRPSDTVHLNYYPIDSDYLLQCDLRKTENPEPFSIATYSGEERKYIKYGKVFMEFEGKAFSLELYQNYALLESEEFSDYLFLPFKDQTNGETTYGGGRYLNLSIADLERNGCRINFNLAYNPWCAYSDGFHCPIPPRANHLNIALKAGEKEFGKPPGH